MNVLALDIGTTTLSAVVVDDITGALVHQTAEDSLSQIHGEKWESLQHPEIIAAKALDMAGNLTRRYAPIAAIGLTGQMHGIVYMDAGGDAVSPLYTWQDARGDQMMGHSGETYAECLTRLTGHPVATGFGATTHYWHVANGCVPEGACCFSTIHDYVGMKLTGRKKALTHASDAASLGLFDRSAGAFDESAIRRAGLDPAFFPQVASGADLIGRTADGIPVAVAIGDNQAGFIGTVKDGADSIMINVGTSGQVSVESRVNVAQAPIESRPLDGAQSILVGSTLCGGRAYAILEGMFRSVLDMAGIQAEDLYGAMNALALEALERPDPLLIDTRFAGTRAEPAKRGAITGITTSNLTAAHLTGGVLQGIAGELHALYLTMNALDGRARTALIGAGNALRKNPALVKALEMAFGLRLHIPVHREEAAYGAALFAMAAAGLKTLKEAQGLISYQ